MAKISAQRLANCILAFCNEHGDYVCNLKLQKLLYYAQGWHLGLYREPLFDDRIEAWVHGPVVPGVYHSFKQFGYQPIPSELDPSHASLADVPNDVWSHIEDVWIAYGGITGYDLERLSHKDTPWITARGGLPSDAPSNNQLTIANMLEFFGTTAGAN